MAIYGKFMVSNTGPSKGRQSIVRVYLAGRLIGSVAPSTQNPLAYCRKHRNSRYTHALMALLVDHGATQGEIDSILPPVV
jgi:hypothetical protein